MAAASDERHRCCSQRFDVFALPFPSRSLSLCVREHDFSPSHRNEAHFYVFLRYRVRQFFVSLFGEEPHAHTDRSAAMCVRLSALPLRRALFLLGEAKAVSVFAAHSEKFRSDRKRESEKKTAQKSNKRETVADVL